MRHGGVFIDMTSPDLKTRRWQSLRASFLASCGDRCSICGQPVDKTLSGRHRLGPTVDHRHPRSRGGDCWDPANLALAHQRCNAAKKNRIKRRRINSRNW